MAWTKQTKREENDRGFIESPGFLVQEFLEDVSTWTKQTKVTE